MKMFTIRDKAAEGFNMPFFQQTIALAERTFKDASQDPNSAASRNPQDFSLWYVGDFDHTTGLVTPKTEPVKIADLA